MREELREKDVRVLKLLSPVGLSGIQVKGACSQVAPWATVPSTICVSQEPLREWTQMLGVARGYRTGESWYLGAPNQHQVPWMTLFLSLDKEQRVSWWGASGTIWSGTEEKITEGEI